MAADANAAVQALRTHPYDLVLLDLRMPGIDGIQLVETLRIWGESVPVLMISGYGTVENAVRAMHIGTDDFLTKPVEPDVLSAKVADLLERRPVTTADDAAVGGMVGRTAVMRALYASLRRVAPQDTTVLVTGETGTGKELVARAVHTLSPRASAPFIAVNCGALGEGVLESELFGHVRGAFTGATNDRKGRFELAGQGTIFLDEIGDTSPSFQAKLLRVLQEREFHPVGGERPRRTEARILAATHRPLETLVANGQFREDLYFRLRVVEIVVPPLRERRGDIGVLANHLLAKAARDLHRNPMRLGDDAVRALEAKDWPGNVRELENAIVRAVALATTATISASDLSVDAPRTTGREPSDSERLTLDDVERAHVERVLRECGGNKRQACRRLGISRPRLDRILERHGIVVSERRLE